MSITGISYVPYPSHFHFDECLWFLNRNFDDCMHTTASTYVIKAIELNNQPILFRVSEEGAALRIEILNGPIGEENQGALADYVREWFDIGRDIEPFYATLKRSKALSYMVDEFYGLRLVGIPDMFEALCWSIIGQQINLTFAYKLKRRLVEQYGRKIEYHGTAHFMFPAPEILSTLTIEDLKALQFSRQKAVYVIEVAKAFVKGEISKQIIENLPTPAEKKKALINLKGIGVWTANYVLMKTLKEPSSIPYGDVGIFQALTNHGIIKERTDIESINTFFASYQGWESYLVFYLWRSLAKKASAA